MNEDELPTADELFADEPEPLTRRQFHTLAEASGLLEQPVRLIGLREKAGKVGVRILLAYHAFGRVIEEVTVGTDRISRLVDYSRRWVEEKRPDVVETGLLSWEKRLDGTTIWTTAFNVENRSDRRDHARPHSDCGQGTANPGKTRQDAAITPNRMGSAVWPWKPGTAPKYRIWADPSEPHETARPQKQCGRLLTNVKVNDVQDSQNIKHSLDLARAHARDAAAPADGEADQEEVPEKKNSSQGEGSLSPVAEADGEAVFLVTNFPCRWPQCDRGVSAAHVHKGEPGESTTAPTFLPPDREPSEVTPEIAAQLAELPRCVGYLHGTPVFVGIARMGPYVRWEDEALVKHEDGVVDLWPWMDPLTVELEGDLAERLDATKEGLLQDAYLAADRQRKEAKRALEEGEEPPAPADEIREEYEAAKSAYEAVSDDRRHPSYPDLRPINDSVDAKIIRLGVDSDIGEAVSEEGAEKLREAAARFGPHIQDEVEDRLAGFVPVYWASEMRFALLYVAKLAEARGDTPKIENVREALDMEFRRLRCLAARFRPHIVEELENWIERGLSEAKAEELEHALQSIWDSAERRGEIPELKNLDEALERAA